jgi:hypothetical protein
VVVTTSTDTASQRYALRRALRRVAPYVALVLAKLWLVGGQRLTAYGSLTIDDQWFVERAAAIRDGDWLGKFDTDTLIKQPGYPVFIALADALHVPLLLAQQLAYAGAVAVLVAVLSRVLAGWRRMLAFGLLLFNPATMNTSVSARVDRSLLYGSLLVLLLACLVALVDAAVPPGRRLAGWCGATSVVLASVWLLREEFVLVAPAVSLAIVIAAILVAGAGMSPRVRNTALLGIALVPVSVPAAWLALRELNESRYGLAVHNIEQTSVPRALGPMFRVEPVTSFDRYPVTVETREVLYGVSPTLAGLRSEIEGGGALRFTTVRPDGVEDLSGAVFQWVLLDAIDATDVAPTGRALDTTLRTIGREIDAACDDGRLACGPPHVGIAPPFDWGRVTALARRAVYATWRMAIVAPFDASAPRGDAAGADRELFERMTGEPLATGEDGALTRGRAIAVGSVRWVYLVLTPVAGTGCAWRLAVAARRRERPHRLVLATVAFGSVLAVSRLAGLAYLDLTAFQALSPSYLAPAHTVAAAAAVALVLADRADGDDAPRGRLSGSRRCGRRCRRWGSAWSPRT